MIAETIPALKDLSAEQKVILAAELWHDAVDVHDNQAADPKLIAALRERLAYYKQHPDEVSTWEDVRARVLARKR
jgi:hypothetical protein